MCSISRCCRSAQLAVDRVVPPRERVHRAGRPDGDRVCGQHAPSAPRRSQTGCLEWRGAPGRLCSAGSHSPSASGARTQLSSGERIARRVSRSQQQCECDDGGQCESSVQSGTERGGKPLRPMPFVSGCSDRFAIGPVNGRGPSISWNRTRPSGVLAAANWRAPKSRLMKPPRSLKVRKHSRIARASGIGRERASATYSSVRLPPDFPIARAPASLRTIAADDSLRQPGPERATVVTCAKWPCGVCVLQASRWADLP